MDRDDRIGMMFFGYASNPCSFFPENFIEFTLLDICVGPGQPAAVGEQLHLGHLPIHKTLTLAKMTVGERSGRLVS